MTLAQVQHATVEDPLLQQVMAMIQTGQWHKVTKDDPYYRVIISFSKVRSELITTEDGNLLLRGSRIVTPQILQHQTVDLAHEGHQGINKTMALLREKVWFPGIDQLVAEKVGSCIACQATTSRKPRDPLKMAKLPTHVWSKVSVDFYGPLPSGDYILAVMDDYSRFPKIEIVHSTSARTVIPKLDRIFLSMGIPDVVRSDNGPPFNSAEFKDFASYIGFKHRKLTPYWPEANGEVENFMKPLGKACTAAQRCWAETCERNFHNW